MEMRNYLVLLLALALFSSFAFADSPAFTGNPTMTNEYIGSDRNYYDFPTVIYSPVISDTDEDLNELSCKIQFSLSESIWFTPETLENLDFNSDLNMCVFNLNYEWGNSGQMQVRFNISDDADNNTSSADMNWWLDNTAPEVVGSATGNQVTLTAVDVATPTGDGVGVKSIFYSLDGNTTWASVDADTLTITGINVAGSHSLDYYVLDNYDNNTSDANYDFVVSDSTAPSVEATTISGFSQVGSNVYGTGTIVGGTVTEIDLNEDSCEYTYDGSTWAEATWNTDHCEVENFTIVGGRDYSLNTRISDNSGNVGTGTAVNVHGAMVVDDMGAVTFDAVGGFLQGLAENIPNLVYFIILGIIVVLVVDAVTGAVGIFEIMKRLK